MDPFLNPELAPTTIDGPPMSAARILQIVLHYLDMFSWQLIAIALLGIGFGLGFYFGRSRARWQMEGDLQEAQDALEWEKRRYADELMRANERARSSQPENGSESSESESEQIRLLRKELQRLYQVLQKSWLSETQAEKQIQQLEARLSVFSKRGKESEEPQTKLDL